MKIEWSYKQYKYWEILTKLRGSKSPLNQPQKPIKDRHQNWAATLQIVLHAYQEKRTGTYIYYPIKNRPKRTNFPFRDWRCASAMALARRDKALPGAVALRWRWSTIQEIMQERAMNALRERYGAASAALAPWRCRGGAGCSNGHLKRRASAMAPPPRGAQKP